MLKYYLPNIANNPVIIRETTARLRAFPSFLYLGIVLLIGYIFILVNWQFIQDRVSNIYFDSNQIRDMFMMFNGSLLIGIVCIVPFISANVITNEKERETWDLLTTTPIRMPSIVFGKLISSVFFVWMLLLSLLPFYGIFFLFGTVQFQEVLVIFAIATELTFVISLIGLYCSSRWSRTVKSVSITYFMAFMYVAGISLFSLLIHGVLFNSRDAGVEYLLSPWPIYFAYFRGPNPSIDYIPINMQYIYHIIENIFLVIILTTMSMRVLYNPPKPKPRKILTDKRLNFNSERIENWFKRFEPAHIIPDGFNPVEMKEFRLLFHKRWMWVSMISLTLASFTVFAYTMMRPEILPPDQMIQMLTVPMIFTPLLIVPYSANSIRGEYDRDTMDILLSTNIRAEEIITGKIRAAFYFYIIRFWAFGTILVVSATATALMNAYSAFSVIPILILTFCTAYFIICAATLVSVLSKNAIMSYAISGFIVFILYFGSIIIGYLLVNLLGHDNFIINNNLIPSPFYSASRLLDSGEGVIMQCIWMIVGAVLCQSTAVKQMEHKFQQWKG